MKKTVLKVEYEEEKLKAIRVSLKEKNRNLENEIISFLEGLYKKNVPKVLKNYIENEEKTEENETKIEQKTEEKSINKIENENNGLVNNRKL